MLVDTGQVYQTFQKEIEEKGRQRPDYNCCDNDLCLLQESYTEINIKKGLSRRRRLSCSTFLFFF